MHATPPVFPQSLTNDRAVGGLWSGASNGWRNRSGLFVLCATPPVAPFEMLLFDEEPPTTEHFHSIGPVTGPH